MRSRKRAAVGPQSSESASFSASSASSSLRARAPARCRSRSAKCEPRRRLNASRALENRFHSSSSVLRSMPRTVRHSSRIALKRSPACFHCVASAASVSASAASASLRATAATRAASRSARWAPTACSACTTSPSSRAASPATSPTTWASARPSRRARALPSVCLGSAPPADSRLASSSASVSTSSKRRAKWARPSAGSPACQEPTDPLTVRGADVDRAVGVDPAPPLGVQGRRRHGMSGRGRRRCRDRVRRLGRVRRLVRMCRGGTRRHGVELVVAARFDARSGVRRRGPRTRVLGDARPVRRGRARRGHVCRCRVRRGQVGRRRYGRRFRWGRARRGQVGRRRCSRRFRRGRVCRGQVSRGRCCRGFRTVLVCGVEPSAVRLRARVLLRHGRLPPPARHDGGRPAAAGPRSAGRRRSMRTVATWDSNSSAPGPKQLRAARRTERWFCRDEPTTPLPSFCDLPGGRSAAAGRRGRAHRDGQVRPRRRARRGPGRGGRQRGRDGPLPGDGRRHGQARAPPSAPAFRTTCSMSWTSTETASVAAYQRAARRGRRGPARRGRTPVLVGARGLYVQAVVDDLEFPGTDPVLRAELEAELGRRRTGGTAHPPGRRRPRRRGGGAAEQRAPDRAGAGGRGAHRPPVPGPTRDGGPPRYGAVLLGVDRPTGELDERVARRVARMFACGLVDGDPRAARPRPGARAAPPPGRSATSRSRPPRRRARGGTRRGRSGHGARHPAVRPPAAVLVPPRPPHRLARPGRAGPARRALVVRDSGRWPAMTPESFTKGHGTENDFVVLPDPDGRST